jgi:hypothetical protein
MGNQEVGYVLEGEMRALLKDYDPRKHSFFHLIKQLPPGAWSANRLGDLYHHLQSAQHAMRVMSFHVPHLTSPDAQQIKLQIFSLRAGSHEAFRRAFKNLGARLPHSESLFEDLGILRPSLRGGTARVVDAVARLFPRSLGPWLLSEMAAPLWQNALHDGLKGAFPNLGREAFFRAPADPLPALELARATVMRHPSQLFEMLRDGHEMAKQFDFLWSDLQSLLLEPSTR